MPNENENFNVAKFVRAWVVVTGIFLIFVVAIFVLGRLPSTPNFAPGTYYETEVWPTARAEQREQLTNYSAYQAEEEVEGAEGTVTYYTIPISVAKGVLVERGLPVFEEGASTAPAPQEMTPTPTPGASQ
jgi:hypothetical protein